LTASFETGVPPTNNTMAGPLLAAQTRDMVRGATSEKLTRRASDASKLANSGVLAAIERCGAG